MLIPLTVTVPEFPATSVAPPTTDWFLPSLVSVWSGPQLATAVSASEQVNRTVTGPLYQPLAFATVVGAPLMLGPMLSTFTVMLWLAAVLSSTLPAASLLQKVTVWTPLPTWKG